MGSNPPQCPDELGSVASQSTTAHSCDVYNNQTDAH